MGKLVNLYVAVCVIPNYGKGDSGTVKKGGKNQITNQQRLLI
jgi:hypothetical protein